MIAETVAWGFAGVMLLLAALILVWIAWEVRHDRADQTKNRDAGQVPKRKTRQLHI